MLLFVLAKLSVVILISLAHVGLYYYLFLFLFLTRSPQWRSWPEVSFQTIIVT